MITMDIFDPEEVAKDGVVDNYGDALDKAYERGSRLVGAIKYVASEIKRKRRRCSGR